MTDEVAPPSEHALAALAGFTGLLTEQPFDAGRWVEPEHRSDGAISMPYAVLSGVAQAFVTLAGGAGCVQPFDWPKWGHSPAGRRFFEDHASVAEADASDIARLLTAAIRQDRFVEGALLGYFESGLMAAIATRAAALLSEQARGTGAAE